MTRPSILKGALVSAALIASQAFAQNGMTGGQDGLHQYNANTLGQWNVSFGVGANASADSWSMSAAGQITPKGGSTITIDDRALSISTNINAAIGLTEWLDFGANLPIYMDWGSDPSGYVNKSDLTKPAIGDVEGWLKLRLLGDKKALFTSALLAQVYVPTGDQDAGLRPRHAWYLADKKKSYTRAYTANDVALGMSAIATVNGEALDVPVRWNTQVGVVYPISEHESVTLLYSTGLNVTACSFADFFLEISGEMRLQDDNYPIDPIVDPFVITPGARFHLNDNMDFAVGVDIAGRMFKNLEVERD